MRFNLLEKHPQHLLDDKIKDDPVVTTLKSKIGFWPLSGVKDKLFKFPTEHLVMCPHSKFEDI